jgi:hypothetical protein
MVKRAGVIETNICAGRKTVKTVTGSRPSPFTATRRGVDEKEWLPLSCLLSILFSLQL